MKNRKYFKKTKNKKIKKVISFNYVGIKIILFNTLLNKIAFREFKEEESVQSYIFHYILKIHGDQTATFEIYLLAKLTQNR